MSEEHQEISNLTPEQRGELADQEIAAILKKYRCVLICTQRTQTTADGQTALVTGTPVVGAMP